MPHPNFNEPLIVASQALVKAGVPLEQAHTKATSVILALQDAGFLSSPMESTAGKVAGPAC